MSTESSAEPPEPSPPDDTYRLSIPSPMVSDPAPVPVLSPPRVAPRRAARPSRNADAWAIYGLNLLIFLTSVCVMTLELTASRLIAKSVGSSLYTWTSVIGVVLAGITLGNLLGGWLADRFDRGRSLAWMYLFASVSCAGVLWLDQLVSPLPRPASFSWPAWVLTVVSLLFLLPSLALGTISPLIASMALARSTRLGTTVGNVYAWGALGSIVGTFLTGFYLVDTWGTRTIVGMTAGVLGVLAVTVTGAPRLFRTAVVCGWLQLLGWLVLAATCTDQVLAYVADSLGTLTTANQSRESARETRQRWHAFGSNVGTRLHELGLALRLRDDQVGAYYDESNYSTILVSDSRNPDGRPVKNLRLDMLTHSIYDPADPTALHYDYERIYAAVTRRTSRLVTESVTLSTAMLPSELFGASQLPTGVTFDPASRTLRVEQPTDEVFKTLLALVPEGPYWSALEDLYQVTNKPLWGGFSMASLASLPAGVTLPEDLELTVRFDASLECLTAYDIVTGPIRDRLIQATPHAAWYAEVQRGRNQSRRSTGLFLGGGGFIFPRWFLQQFPTSPRVEVAELDPAVYRVSVEALGLTVDEQSRIRTTIGDARNTVDDRLRENERRAAAGDTPERFDFIYGDAFSGFNIPAHLTTVEFLRKVDALLTDDGVFLANIIEIYPRAEYPGQFRGTGEVDYKGPLPAGAARFEFSSAEFSSPGVRFHPLEFKAYGRDDYRIRAVALISADDERRLTQVDLATTAGGEDAKSAWTQTVARLAAQTRDRIAFAGTIPDGLKAANGALEAWVPAPPPWEQIEVCRLGSAIPDSYVLGVRGILSPDAENRLAAMEAGNTEWGKAIRTAADRSRQPGPGRFLGRYAATAAEVFPNLYLFSTESSQPGNQRDTFVMVCSRRPLDLKGLSETGEWTGDWFAARETRVETGPRLLGQMAAVLSLAENQILTDDFAPVDNLLVPVFADP